MDYAGQIRPININEEMRGSYLDYAMSVIVARALPDARDGLKPVHRRILYSMYDMGMRSNAQYRKSARIVGDVLGKYHPHGDSSVYDAMARMAQDFSLRYPLVDGQGNFGSVDGDSPAAMRYTEARMARICEEMLVDIEMETVDFVDNYDGTTQEPSVLPARLPNMLLNGANGIAVGMATNIPPHNLRELSAAIAYMIEHYQQLDDISVDDLMQFVTGPDFPTGAEVAAGDELKEAYATGRGRVIVRARAELEEGKNGRFRIVIREIPYQITKTSIIERIVALVREGRLPLVADLRDESDRNGLRLVIELKNGAQPQKALNQLYKYTQLQSTYSIQMLALVNGEPRTLSLKRMLQIHIEHRFEVITRRSHFELGKRRARAHILEGLLKALSSIDAIIQTIRAAEDTESAREALMTRFGLSEAQSNAILELQLRRLAALEQQKLTEEYNEVAARIAYLEDLLQSPEKILALIRDDVQELSEKYGDDRRTKINYGIAADIDEDDLNTREEVVILLTKQGYIKRVPASEYRAQRRGGKGVKGVRMREEDGPQALVAASSHDTLLFFTDRGKVYSVRRAYELPQASRDSRGSLVQMMLAVSPDERITAIVPVERFDISGYFVLATRYGRIKRVQLDEFDAVRSSGLIAMALDEGDTLNWAIYTDGDQDIIVATQNGKISRFHEREVRVMGRGAAGVMAVRLIGEDIVAGVDVVRANDSEVLVVTDKAYGKRTPLEEYRAKGRFIQGNRAMSNDERLGRIVDMRVMNPEDDILVLTTNGIVMRTRLDEVRQTGRMAMGTRLIDLGKNDSVASIAIMEGSVEPDESDEGEETGPEANGAGDA
jgi:DNA gyrase subunit A